MLKRSIEEYTDPDNIDKGSAMDNLQESVSTVDIYTRSLYIRHKYDRNRVKRPKKDAADWWQVCSLAHLYLSVERGLEVEGLSAIVWENRAEATDRGQPISFIFRLFFTFIQFGWKAMFLFTISF